MALILEDLEEKNWLICDSCKNLCKNPNYDFDLKLDECCICSYSNVKCSTCSERKAKNKKSKNK